MSENHRYIEACEKCYLALRASTLPKKTSQRNQYLETCVWSIMSISHYLIIFSNFEHIIYMMFIIELLCDDVGCDRCAGLLRHRVTSSHIHSYPLISSHILLLLVIQAWMSHNFNHGAYFAIQHIYIYTIYIYTYLSWVLPARQSHPTWSQRYFFWCSWSLFGGFLKWGYPQNTPKYPKWSFLVGKPMVVGYHHFRKPPFESVS